MNPIKFRYVFGIEGQPDTYFFRYFTIEEIEQGKSYIPLPEYKIISRDRFTGARDKTGKEIYLNDKFYDDCCEFIVTYCDEYASFMITETDPLGDFCFQIEIIGNIYGVK